MSKLQKKLIIFISFLQLLILSSCSKSSDDVKASVEAKKFIVIFITNGETSLSATIAEEGKIISEPPTPSKTGFIFEGWYKEAGLINKWNFTTDVVTSDTTLYAKWVAKAYRVSFNTNGGTAVSTTIAEEGKIISETTIPSKTGFTFEGWYKEAGLINKWNFTTDKVTSNITLYAKWVVKTYRVSFNTNGGTVISAKIVEEGKTITEPSASTNLGSIVEGWYKEKELTTKWNFATDTVLGDITLFAKWKENEVLVEKGIAGMSGLSMTNSFYIQKTEVTQRQFEELMGYNPSWFEGKPNNPVERVTWYDAVVYANKLSRKEGLEPYYVIRDILTSENRIIGATISEKTSSLFNGYRLPTKEQWEYAARGGNKSNGYIYAGSNEYSEVAWLLDNNTPYGTKAVGRKKANELGIYDMNGNVWEWINSGSLTQGICGGSWLINASGAIVTVISAEKSNYYNSGIGFRLVRPY